jgi:hypothetical protein
VTLSNHFGVESLHRRVAATFHCRPDAAKERAIVEAPADPESAAGATQAETGTDP